MSLISTDNSIDVKESNALIPQLNNFIKDIQYLIHNHIHIPTESTLNNIKLLNDFYTIYQDSELRKVFINTIKEYKNTESNNNQVITINTKDNQLQVVPHVSNTENNRIAEEAKEESQRKKESDTSGKYEEAFKKMLDESYNKMIKMGHFDRFAIDVVREDYTINDI
jgi:hypothetical protein